MSAFLGIKKLRQSGLSPAREQRHCNMHVSDLASEKFQDSKLQCGVVVGGWRSWLSVKKYVRFHGGFMPVSCPVVQFMVVCRPNEWPCVPWYYDSYVAEFWREVGGPTKKHKVETNRQNGKAK